MDTMHTRQNYGVIEKSRVNVLTAGYQFVAWKTKLKKNGISFIKSLLRFYF